MDSASTEHKITIKSRLFNEELVSDREIEFSSNNPTGVYNSAKK